MELRPYQREAVEAVYNHLREKKNNPCVVLPTGTGKSLVLAQIAKDAVTLWGGRVLILAHVKELLEQNADKTRRLCPDLPIGIFSAGLNSRSTKEPVIVAGIQSVYNKAELLGKFDLIIVDEAHSIASEGDGMYRTFLKDMQEFNPRVRLIGLTATPFRLKGGLICKPENLLNEICYEANLKEMIQQGYLSPLISRAGHAEADFGNLHIRGGEFIADEIEAAMDTDQLVTAACREIVDLTRDRKSVLIFTSSVKHCQHVAEAIRGYSGQECAVVTGETPAGERAEILDRFKGKAVPADLFGTPKPPLKYLCNVNVLTTGFDAVNTDCVVLLRPTNSAGLLVQMVGRGTRLSPETGKQNCLVLDYGGNIMRHGPVDMIHVKDKTSGNGEAPAKKCPQCYALIHAAYAKCPQCGYVFPPSNHSELTQHAAHNGIISGEVFMDEYEVRRTFYEIHRKRNAPDDAPSTMRIDYEVAFQTYKSEWVCPEHTGYARTKFIKWWKARAPEWLPVPHSAAEAVRLAREGYLAETKKITVRSTAGEKFETIAKYELGPCPEREPGDDTAEVDMSGDPHVEDFDPDEIPF